MSERRGRKRAERSDKVANHKVIRTAFMKIVRGKKKAPTIDELCKETGLSHNTIKKHLKTLEFTSDNNPFRILTPEVIASIYKRATGYLESDLHFSSFQGAVTQTPYKKKIAPDVSAQKLWMQLIENWSEKTQHDITTGGEKIKQVIKIGDKEIEFE